MDAKSSQLFCIWKPNIAASVSQPNWIQLKPTKEVCLIGSYCFSLLFPYFAARLTKLCF